MMDFSKLETKLGVTFKDKDSLQQAFVHRSYVNENPDFELDHNERLEFLGDAVMELVVTDYLFRNYQDPEGKLTAWRAALVNTKMISQVARELGFNDYLMLSRGETKDTGKARECILANTFEAVIGAIYLDQGYKKTDSFIDEFLLTKLPRILEEKLYIDAKSFFQEESQEQLGITPTYDVLKEWGPDHAKNFKIGVFLEEEMAGQAQGRSKQEAQEKAARQALENKGWLE